jgi:hypothetical protein
MLYKHEYCPRSKCFVSQPIVLLEPNLGSIFYYDGRPLMSMEDASALLLLEEFCITHT